MMRHILALFSASVLISVIPAAAQGLRTNGWSVPRTPDGQPDLQGLWSNTTITPMERPAQLAGKEFFTEQEAAAYEKQVNTRRDQGYLTDSGGPFRKAWWDSGNTIVKTRRTSIVIDPPDGKIPALLPEAMKTERARREATRRPAAGPEDRPLNERCIVWPTDGPPMVSSNYNNNYRIVQIPGFVVIYIEMIHDVRIIPLDARPHLAAEVRNWMGDSRGHWEGDTLVVDTTNFNGKASFHGSDRNLHVIERFTRTDANTILYRFTIDDPTAFQSAWTGEVPWSAAPGPIYEYACHEGNYQSMQAMLEAARADEKAAAEVRK